MGAPNIVLSNLSEEFMQAIIEAGLDKLQDYIIWKNNIVVCLRNSNGYE